MVNLVHMSQRMVLLKVSIVITSLNNICFCISVSKSLRKSKIVWSLTSRTLQHRGRENTRTYSRIIYSKQMGNPFRVQRSKGKIEAEIVSKYPTAGGGLGWTLKSRCTVF